MILYIMNTSLEMVKVIDTTSSVIWTRRYFEAGDFEIYMKADSEILEYLKPDNFVKRFDSDMVGIIERVEVNTDPEDGDYITVTGRDLKSLLTRRIVWSQTSVSGTVKECVEKLINENVISPTLESRAIENFILGTYETGTELSMSAQYTGDILYNVIVDICKSCGYGWNVRLDENNQFVFEMFEGLNRSYEQNENNFVVFSPDFNNLLATNYSNDKLNEKNTVNVMGEGEGLLRRNLGVGTTPGLLRREQFVDARDITSDTGIEVTETFNVSSRYGYHDFANYIYKISSVTVNGESSSNYTHNNPYWNNRRVYFHDAKSAWEKNDAGEWVEDYVTYSVSITYNKGLSPTEYNALLNQRGLEKLAEMTSTESFDGDVDSTHQYILDEDFFVGDIVQVVNEYGLSASPRILEIIECEDANGITVVPTFETWEV